MLDALSFLSLLLTLSVCSATELTFELPDNEKQCFYEVIAKDTKSTIMFQVVNGGNYDVDLEVSAPGGAVIARFQREQHGEHSFAASVTGEHALCFSNEFSSFSHKLVYMDWEIGDEDKLPGIDNSPTVMTRMETYAQQVHETLVVIDDYQTEYRLNEASGRRRAEELNQRVALWSMGETLAILCVTLAQVILLKRFFSDKKSIQVSASSRGPPYTAF